MPQLATDDISTCKRLDVLARANCDVSIYLWIPLWHLRDNKVCTGRWVWLHCFITRFLFTLFKDKLKNKNPIQIGTYSLYSFTIQFWRCEYKNRCTLAYFYINIYKLPSTFPSFSKIYANFWKSPFLFYIELRDSSRKITLFSLLLSYSSFLLLIRLASFFLR